MLHINVLCLILALRVLGQSYAPFVVFVDYDNHFRFISGRFVGVFLLLLCLSVSSLTCRYVGSLLCRYVGTCIALAAGSLAPALAASLAPSRAFPLTLLSAVILRWHLLWHWLLRWHLIQLLSSWWPVRWHLLSS